MANADLKHGWREAIRSLWFLPSLSILAALATVGAFSRITIAIDSPLRPFLFSGDANAARQVLTVVSGSMITVTSLVFVLTVVALQIASTQFSPRLLRSFLQDPGTRLVLSVFVSTFAYSLGGLFAVGRANPNGIIFVPRLAVTGSLFLAIASVGMLVYYIQHVTNAIRIDTVMLNVRQSTLAALAVHYPTTLVHDKAVVTPPLPPSGAIVIPARKSGYLQEVHANALYELAMRKQVTIRVRPQVGHHLVAGSALGWAWSAAGDSLDQDALTKEVQGTVAMTPERKVDEDVAFGIRQLIDIAMRGVAPSVNDPYTAVQAVQHLTIILVAMAKVDTTDITLYEGDALRVYVPTADFVLALSTVVDSVRRTAASRPRVVVALLRLLETVAACGTSAHRRSVVGSHVAPIVEDAQRAIPQAVDLKPVLAMAKDVQYAAQHGQVPGVEPVSMD
jgi:uncharacterized membrane protein